MTTALASAQMKTFPKISYFRETFGTKPVKVELAPPARLSDFIVDAADADGKPIKRLELSLKQYLELVMANHTDVQVQYLNLETSKNNIMYQEAAWDPKSVSVTFRPSWSTSDPRPNDPFGEVSKSESWPVTFGFNQSLPTGQSISVSGNGSKHASAGGNPSYSSGMSFGVTQPLLRGRASYVVRYSLMSAQSSYKVQEFTLRNSLINTVNSAESQYWAAVQARESLRVQEKALDTSKKQWDFIQQQFKLGAISELSTYSSQTSVMSAEVNLSQAQYALRDQEDRIRRQIGADLDPAVRALPILLTETIDLGPAESVDRDRELTVQKALATHPSLRASMQSLDFYDTTLANRRNALMPQLDLNLSYSGAGSGGIYTPFGGGTSIPGGLGDALHQMFAWGSPTYGASLTLTLPIRNRQTSLDLTNALIQKKTLMLNLRKSQQDMRLNVLAALTALENSKKNSQLTDEKLLWTRKDFAGKQLQYDLGTTDINFLVQAEQALAVAELQSVQAKLQVRQALLSLLQTTGELLDDRGIVVTAPTSPRSLTSPTSPMAPTSPAAPTAPAK